MEKESLAHLVGRMDIISSILYIQLAGTITFILGVITFLWRERTSIKTLKEELDKKIDDQFTELDDKRQTMNNLQIKILERMKAIIKICRLQHGHNPYIDDDGENGNGD